MARSLTRAGIAGVAALAVGTLSALPAAAQLITAVDAVAITVEDLDRALPFYTEVLPFTVEEERELTGIEVSRLFGVFGTRARVARLTLGSEAIELVDFVAPTDGRPIPPDSRSNDLWFQHVAIIVSDMDAAYEHLRTHDVVHASQGPQVLPDWNPNAGGIAAFYFKDPDGNVLEILEFPPDKGDPRWQDDSALFLGIDHTAIVVSDTEASLALYRDLLGLTVAGGAENYGIEQERLNNVFGARLRITALVAEEGPGIEFLEYLAPSTGRPAPPDTQTNDLWHWHIILETADAEAVFTETRGPEAAFVSPGTIDVPDEMTGFDAGLMLRDRDGHGLLVVQP